MLARYALFLIGSIFCSSVIGSENSLEESKEKIVIRKSCKIEPRRGDHYKVDVGLGTIPAGERVRIVVEVVNPYDRLFEFDFMRPGCSCLDSKISSGIIEPYGSIEIEFSLETPLQVKSVNQLVGAKLGTKGDARTSLLVSLSYNLEGVLSFVDKMVSVKGIPGEELVEWKVPVLITSPCKPENMRIAPKGAFRDLVDARLLEDGKSQYVFCTMPAAKLTASGISGELEITEEGTVRRSGVLCVVTLVPDVEIAPDRVYLRFTEKDNCFRGTMLAKFRAGLLENVANLASGPKVEVTCKPREPEREENEQEFVFKASAKHIAKNVYRISIEARTVSADRSYLGGGKINVEYELRALNRKWQKSGSVVVSNMGSTLSEEGNE